MNLTEKLIKILKDTGSLEKQGENTSQHYKYFSEAQLMGELRHRFAAEGILFVTDVLTSETKEVERNTRNGIQKYALVSVHTRHTFKCDKEELVVTSQGQGIDSGDKAIYKAITGATKYALMKLFMITDHQDPEADPDADNFIPITKEQDKKAACLKIREWLKIKKIPESFITKDYECEKLEDLKLEDLDFINAEKYRKRTEERYSQL